MIFVILLVLGSIALALTVLVASPRQPAAGLAAARLLGAVGAPARLLLGTLLASLTVMERYGYNSRTPRTTSTPG